MFNDRWNACGICDLGYFRPGAVELGDFKKNLIITVGPMEFVTLGYFRSGGVELGVVWAEFIMIVESRPRWNAEALVTLAYCRSETGDACGGMWYRYNIL